MIEEITKRINQAIVDHVFPGCVVGFIKNNQTTILPFGNFTYQLDSPIVKADTIYDIASVTKAIPTNCLALKLIDEKRLSLEDKIIDYLPQYNSQYRDLVKIKHLLTYSMVLDIDRPLSSHINESPDDILKLILNAPLQNPPGEKFLYTNTPNILLGLIVEKVYEKSLDAIADDLFFKPLEMSCTTFHPEKYLPSTIPPTEISDTRGIVQGFVHDEVTWALQKKIIPGCSGLFSNATDLLKFSQILLSKNNQYFSSEIVNQMQTNQLTNIDVSYGLGWELNQPRFMGKNVDPKTFGKTGFTGNMILMNIQKQISMVLLSNTTYPTRKSDATLINQVRADVADIIFST